MTTFKEIVINEYKKLLDNMQHTYAKTFKNIELLHNFEENVNNKNIDSIIKNKESLQKEDKYIEKLSDKISSKISNPNQNIVKNNDKYVFLNPYQYYNENPEHILNHIKDLYIKSNISYKDIYQPKLKTRVISLDSVIRSIKKDGDIPNNLKESLIYAYDNIANKTKMKYSKDIYDQYVLNLIAQYYIDKDDNLSLDDESFKRELEVHSKDIIPETSNKEDKSLKDKLKSDVSKTIVRALSGEGLHFNKIKIDENLLKKNILKVRYINSNRKINNKFLKEDYQISNNMKNTILKNTNLNKLTKNEYDVYNTLQKYRKNYNLQLLISSYLAGNKSKNLYNKIKELLYKNYKNNIINKKQYQNIINKL